MQRRTVARPIQLPMQLLQRDRTISSPEKPTADHQHVRRGLRVSSGWRQSGTLTVALCDCAMPSTRWCCTVRSSLGTILEDSAEEASVNSGTTGSVTSSKHPTTQVP